jgi:translation initiation factor 1A
MVQNCGNGGRSHRSGCKTGQNTDNRELVFKEPIEQDYARVCQMLGNNRCRVITENDKIERIAIICGRMRKKHIHNIVTNDLVLISFREYQDNKVDIIHVYTSDEMKQLVAYGEISCNQDQDLQNIVFSNI